MRKSESSALFSSHCFSTDNVVKLAQNYRPDLGHQICVPDHQESGEENE